MSKGLILEVKGEEAIVLTSEGEFRSVRKMKHQDLHVGDEIDVPNVQVVDFSQKRRKNVISTIGLVASFLLVFVSVFALVPIGNDDEAIAFVNLDINPSIEIGLNKSLNVIKITGLNAKGRIIAEYLEGYVGNSLDETTYQIILAAKELGYFENNRDILLSTSFVDESTEQEYNQQLEEALHRVEQKVVEHKVIVDKQEPLSNQTGQDSTPEVDDTQGKEETPEQNTGRTTNSIFIHQVKITQEIRAEAEKHGISPGKYMIYLAALEQGLEIELEDVKENSITQLINDLKGISVVIGSEKDSSQDRQADEQNDQSKEQKDTKSDQEENKEEEKRLAPPGLTKKAEKDQEKKEDPDKPKQDGKKDDDDDRDRNRDEDNEDSKAEYRITITIPSESTIELDLNNFLPARETAEKKKRHNNRDSKRNDRSDKAQKVRVPDRNQNSNESNERENRDDDRDDSANSDNDD